MKIQNGAVSALLGGAILLAAGCESTSGRAEDARIYRTVAAQLDTGGTYYQIMNPRYVFEAADRIGVQLFNSFTSMPEPPENFTEIMDASLHMALAYRLSGLEDIQGCGSSSVRVSDDREPLLFRNRTFLAVRPESKGFLWALPGTENRPLAASWNALPADVDSAFEFELRPDAVYRVFAQSEKFSQYLHDERIALFVGEPPEKLLAGLSGVVGFASIAAEGSDEALSGNHLMLSLPDGEGKLAGLLRKVVLFLPGAKVENERIEFGTVLGEHAPKARPVAMLKEGRITLYSSLAAEKAFTAPEKKLAATEAFQRLSAGLPESGIGYLYNNESYAKVFNLLMEEFELSFRVNPDSWTPSQLTVLTRDGNNFLATGNSSLDSNQSKLVNQLVLPVAVGSMAAKEYLKRNGGLLPGAEESAEAPDTTGECQIKLELFKDALAQYAERHGGAYPEKENIEGIRALLAGKFLPLEATVCPGAFGEDEPAESPELFDIGNCSFIYFGGFTTKSNPKLPLVADWPFNHRGAVNVLLVDGTIEKLELETDNCKRIVSKLQTMYQYNEKEFQNLIRQADKLDKMFELE